ncbi:lipopolysaccharide biosynthesis protein [Jeotgalibacillus marinus]|uniref:Lipopolysaccharide biosynthesis protein n=1 Tax=Jeotgalibacillus marinus TaxID=86667 RepID=A0ABV3Q0D6_9BACL
MSKTKNSFSKNVLTVLTGTTFAQALPIIASPIITRLYTPEEFGEFGLFIAVLAVLSVIVCLRYDLAIALPNDDRKAVNVLALSVTSAAIFSSVLLVLAFIINMTSIIPEINPDLTTVIWILPFAVLLTGIFQSLLNWSIRTEKFKVIATTQIHRSTTIVSGQISTGFFMNSSLTLMLSQLVGQLIAVISILKSSLVDILKHKEHIKKKVMKEQLFKYKKFPVFNSWSSLLNAGSVQLPLFMLAFFFNPVIVGFYTLAHRVLAAPISIIGTAIAQPYLQKATEKNRENKLGEFSLQIFKVLLSIGLVPIILISIIAPELFATIFGATWSKAGVYVQLISIWLLFVFIVSPLSHIFTILELQKESLNFNIVLFLSRIAVLTIGGLTGNDVITIGLFGITGAILYFLQLLWLLRKTGVKISLTVKSLWNEFLFGIPFIIILIVSKIFINTDLFIFVITLIILFLFVLIRFKKFYLNLLKTK